MEGGGIPPRTVEEVFRDFSGRRAGMLKALTEDVEDFYRKCDPEKENLCLYGYPDATWEVDLPAEEVPPELPEPALGINFARDGMERKDWLSLVAVHSDAWLLAVSFYYGARFDKNERKRLFHLINDLPTVFDMVTGKKQVKEMKPINSSANSKKTTGNKNATSSQKISGKRAAHVETKPPKQQKEEEPDEDDDDAGETVCGICAGPYGANEFWIGCDVCEKWFHGKCVKITPARAEHIKQYKCPTCSKRART
ncbi:hypothetical protein CBR_g40795 [Chara braunii]|uniref:PHD-type domain-containing protein n=1 Tax=Chara braunii TaxID=69332 RepID=A0A388LUR9_CHABU|nr:hypothetical protein CBR_g40795 [Chara braunii]|eukprot:GBG85983.1 hypothetical protein CBR_g40795 [Chara braunii]